MLREMPPVEMREVQVGELRSWLCAVVGDGSLVPGLVIAADEEVMADAIKLA